MTRRLACATLVVCLLASLRAADAQTPTFRGATDTVRVFVTVTDRDGRLVTTLAQGDFEVRDEGAAQPVTLFDNTPQPVRLIVMLDVSGSMSGNLPLLREASEQLFTRLRPDDRVRVGSFGEEVRISDAFTKDRSTMREALPGSINPEAPTPLWRALDEAIAAFKDEGDERAVVLVLSDGKDSGQLDFRRKSTSQAEVIERARRDNVMIYAVGMRSRGQRQMMGPSVGMQGLRDAVLADQADPGLARVAEETGGGYIEIRYGQDLASAFAQVADELHAQYLLGFDPPKRDGKVHDIDVKVGQKGMTARARKSYVAPRAR